MRLNRPLWKQLRWFTLFLAAFFLLTAVAQYKYVHYQMHTWAEDVLRKWGDDLERQIGIQDGWDLKKYEQTSPMAPQWILIGNDTLRHDIFTEVQEANPSDFIPDLIEITPDYSMTQELQSVPIGRTTARVFGKKLEDGWLIVSYYDFDYPQQGEVDRKLRSAAQQFGSSTRKALDVRMNETDKDLHWAILDGHGKLLYQYGCLPFEGDVNPSISLRDGPNWRRLDGKDYLILVRLLKDKDHHQIGEAIVPFDVSRLANALVRERNFGFLLAAVSFIFFLAISAGLLGRTESRREVLETTFEKYVSSQVLTEILKDPSNIHLGGEGKGVTVFFSDIRGFTAIAETMEPEALVALLNRYFDVMSEEIVKTGGTIDKYIGDAIMAFWGAPIEDAEQAEHAVHASLAMLQKLKDLNMELAAEGRPEISIRIGLHSGRAIVGNVGSSRRFDYTVIGDTVNAASRMEGLNKEHGTQIIISDMVRNFLRDKTKWKSLGPVTVKGKSEQINIYTLT
jgi:class 3 adenylate cyclase